MMQTMWSPHGNSEDRLAVLDLLSKHSSRERMRCEKYLQINTVGLQFGLLEVEVQSTLGFATTDKAANLGLATRNAVTDVFMYQITTLYLATSNLDSY